MKSILTIPRSPRWLLASSAGALLFSLGWLFGAYHAKPEYYTGVLETIDTNKGIGRFRFIPPTQIEGVEKIDLDLRPYAQVTRFSYITGATRLSEDLPCVFWIGRKNPQGITILRDLIGLIDIDANTEKTEPNNAMEPTPVNVTVPADAGTAPFTSVAHLGR